MKRFWHNFTYIHPKVRAMIEEQSEKAQVPVQYLTSEAVCARDAVQSVLGRALGRAHLSHHRAEMARRQSSSI
ncbi:UNVERIFIED_CONTAM: hypothetical protein ABID98_005884 [Brevibacillus sp. OAP136]